MGDGMRGQLDMFGNGQTGNEGYDAFVDKFKPKLTTDDCYTPENIYDAIADWVAKEYSLNRDRFVRPFWPGGDYKRFDYPDDCVVVDNPPFSLLAEIKDFYIAAGIRFFIFGPSLTLLSRRRRLCHIVAGCDITYENGAVVKTGFVTNLDDQYAIRTAPDLHKIVAKIDKENRKKDTVELPKYIYPDHIVTTAICQRWAHYGVDYRLRYDDCEWVGSIDAQRAKGKAIFGGGYLLSTRAAAERAAAERAAAERAAAERAAATRWQLSDRERDVIAMLDRRNEVAVSE